MLRASFFFFILGLAALFLGTFGIASLSFELGRILLFICLAISILTFLLSLTHDPL